VSVRRKAKNQTKGQSQPQCRREKYGKRRAKQTLVKREQAAWEDEIRRGGESHRREVKKRQEAPVDGADQVNFVK